MGRRKRPLFTSKARRRATWRSPGVLAGLVLVVLFMGLLAYGLASSSPDGRIDGKLADAKPADAPDFQLPVLERGSLGPLARKIGPAFADGRVALRELRGVPIVLNFWASWCPPCRTEAPRLERTWRSVRANGVLLLGLDMQDVTSDARGFIREFDLSYPNLRDRSDDAAQQWGVAALPETFFVDSKGRVVGHVIGTVSGPQLRSGIAAARAGRPEGPGRGGDQRPTR